MLEGTEDVATVPLSPPTVLVTDHDDGNRIVSRTVHERPAQSSAPNELAESSPSEDVASSRQRQLKAPSDFEPETVGRSAKIDNVQAAAPASASTILISDDDDHHGAVSGAEQESPPRPALLKSHTEDHSPKQGVPHRQRPFAKFFPPNGTNPLPGGLSPRSTNLNAAAPPGQQLKRQNSYLQSEEPRGPKTRRRRSVSEVSGPSVNQSTPWQISPRIVYHVPYTSSQRSNLNFDLIIVYFFKGDDTREPHKSFFECPEAEVRRERKATPVAASGQNDEVLKTNFQLPQGTNMVSNESPRGEPVRSMIWLTHPTMLPEVLPFNRTICVGYDLDSTSKNSVINFSKASEQLVDVLDKERKTCRTRPVTLIGHGLGCRIVQHVFMRPATNERIRSLQDVCAGVLFLHSSTDSADGTESVSNADAENATPNVTADTNATRTKPEPACPFQISGQNSREPSILHHVLQHGAAGKDKPQSFRFPTKNDRIFQQLSAKIVEWSEIHQLMNAVAKADYVTLRQLIQDGIKINQRKNSSQMTALHVACQTTSSQSHHIHLLIEDGKADVTLQDGCRRTPLHYALDRDSPDLEIVRELLEAGAETFVSDQNDVTPMDMARSCSASRVRKLLRKRPLVNGPSAVKGFVNHASPHSPQAQEVCKGYQMAATEMYLNRGSLTEKHLPRHFLIDEAIYGERSLETLLNETRSSSIKDELVCRWYHLPANNMTWVEDLFRNRFRMDPNVWSEQVRDSEWPHGRCIKPHTSQFTTEAGEAILAICVPYLSYEDNYRQASVSATVREQIPSTQTKWFKPMREEIAYGLRGPESLDTLAVPLSMNGRSVSDSDLGAYIRHLRPPSRSDSEPSAPDEHIPTQFSFKIASPYDSDEDSDAGTSDGGKFQAATVRLSKEEETLVQAYLHHDPPLHIRRTLDQYYYYMLEDTRLRDADQVVTRWARDKLHKNRHNILMVDQLWIWVVKGKDGPDRVVSCFPERQGCASGLLDYLQRNILHHNTDKRQPIKTTADLVAQIVTTCSDVFSWSQEAELARFLHFFEATVGRVGDDEIRLLNDFTRSSERLHALKESHFHYTKNKDKFLIEMLDIRPQVTLLTEAKDIRDEIKIILHVLGEQRRVLADESIPSFFSQSPGDLSGKEPSKALTKPLRIIDRAIGDFKKMDKQMKEIHDDLNHLLDLQQKQATVWEARSTREGARATSRQGNVMVIFTMVTIIFLPLSFMASFFALEIRELPSDATGQTNWPLHRVCAYLFGISFAVIIPFIALAFASELVYTACHVAEERWLIPRSINVLSLLSVSFMKGSCEAAIGRIEKHRRDCYGDQEDPFQEAAQSTQQHISLSTRTNSEKWSSSELTAFEVDPKDGTERGRKNAGLPRWLMRRRRSPSRASDEDV